jgi:ABC-2 type transport system permease protein
MNAQWDDVQQAVPVRTMEPRPLLWSIRREIWENRSVYMAPLIVTAVVLFATLAQTTMSVPKKIRTIDSVPAAKRHATISKPYSLAPAPIMFSTILVGMFYCLDALYGERRDRSILFWKSLPVSDGTAVLSKVAIPMTILPAIGFVLGMATQIVILVQNSLLLAGHRLDPGILWREMHYPQEFLIAAYGLTAFTLWHAPIYAWLLLVSAWARRAPILWAVMPWIALMAIEKIIFGTFAVGNLIKYRFGGAMGIAFMGVEKQGGAIDHLSQLSPVRYLTTPGLWAGWLFAAACLGVAVRLRRNREPI